MKYLLFFLFIYTFAFSADNVCNISGVIGEKDGSALDVLINKEPENKLRADYKPKELITLPSEWMAPPYRGTGASLRKEAYDGYKALREAALKLGINLLVRSSYRSYSNQCGNLQGKIQKWIHTLGSVDKGKAYAYKSVAEPGRSEHQLGTAVDIVLAQLQYKFDFDFDVTKEFKWLKENAHKFGFIMSYPYREDDKDGMGYNNSTKYYYEPWHWRYVGVELATYRYENPQPCVSYSRADKNIEPLEECLNQHSHRVEDSEL